MCREQTRLRRDAPRRSKGRMRCVLIAVALGVSACGSGGGASVSRPAIASSAPVGPPLSASQLIARAETICRQRNTAIDAVRLPGVSAEDVVRFASQSAALEQTAFTALGRLNPPASMAGDWHKVLAYDRSLLDDVIELEEAAEHHDKQIIPTLTRTAETVKQQLLATAQRDGFKYCARLR
jgi:hypothetical protein